MRYATAALLCVLGTLMGGSAGAATADDVKWINQCIRDNKDEKAKPEVIRKYCECMNNKMDDNETQSITQWEKTHVKERTECDRVSGWK